MYRITIYKASITIFRLPRFAYKSKDSANQDDRCPSNKSQKDLVKIQTYKPKFY